MAFHHDSTNKEILFRRQRQRESDRKRQLRRDLLSVGPLAKDLQQPGLGEAKPGVPNPSQGSPVGRKLLTA